MKLLQAIGFKLLPPKRIIGERDWVYGILCRGRRLNTGEHVSIDSPLTLLIGNGQYGEDDDIDYTEPEYYYEEDEDEIGAYDEFEEVKETVPTEQQKEETEDY